MFYDDNIVLCGASAYEKKFYINENFDTLPEVDVYKRQSEYSDGSH